MSPNCGNGSVGDKIYHRSQLLMVIKPPTPTPTNTPTPTVEPVSAIPATSTHAVYVGSQLAEGYDMGVDSSNGQTDWVTDNDGHTCMAYPSGEDWGAEFLTFGEPTDPPRSGQDLSGFQALSLELRTDASGGSVWIGLKDSEDEDDGQETKLLLSDLTEEWQTYTFSLSNFETADLTSLYIVTEFVFDQDTPPGIVCFRNIQYFPEGIELSTATPIVVSTPTAVPTQVPTTPTSTIAPATPTPVSTPTPSVSSHAIYVGSQLATGYGMGVDSSGGQTGWATNNNGEICMAYPSGQDWGAVFITVGNPSPPPHPAQDFSQYNTLSLQLRGNSGGEKVWIGLKDNTDADDGREVKIPVSNLTTEWQTFTFPLSSFSKADLARLYVVTEFVFEPGTSAETVCFCNIQYLP